MVHAPNAVGSAAKRLRDYMSPAILYVDDDAPNLDLFRRWFDEQFTILTAASGPQALDLLEKQEVAVVISDQRMAPMPGIELLSRVEQRWPLATRMLLTAYSDRELLLSAIQRGRVHDYVLKPWQPEDLAGRLRHGVEQWRRRADLVRAESERDELRTQVETAFGAIVGLEAGLKGIDDALGRIAPTDSTVMIRGESGTGKELLAREIHRRSRRAEKAFVRVNCASFAEGVLESELFGHEAGAFTGAQKARAGRFEQADGGTLFLDEIGDVSPMLQVRLLRVLQEREFERVGGNRTIKVDIRLIAATHRLLEQMVQSGEFREDLFYRLNVVPLLVPPLRARANDIALLAEHFLIHLGREMGKQLRLAPEALEALRRYDWPGNVRELRNVIERAAVLADPVAILGEADLTFDFAARGEAASVFNEIAEEEAERIRDALRKSGGSKARAAQLLGIPRTTLNDRIRKLAIR
jgi:DNA-binding NtrC family response regulator